MDGSESLADEIFLDRPSYESPIPAAPVKKFLGWHRPRKQFVRTRQWQGEIAALLRDHPKTHGSTLSYMGLPGADLLDLRHFHTTICTPNGLSLKFLGFNTGAKPGSKNYDEMTISVDEVRRLEMVDEQSQIIPDNFALLGSVKSFAFSVARKMGPFDIVNLDLCDGFGKGAPGAASSSYYDAICQLMALQSFHDRPWILFLTTRTDRPTVHPDVLERMSTLYKNNLQDHENFRAASIENFNVDSGNLDQALQTAPGHLSVFLTGLAKWFISVALGGRPQIGVHLRSAMGYKIVKDSTEVDMVSLAFRCVPSEGAFPDPTGLARNAAIALDEVSLALKAIGKVATMKDVDDLLANNDSLKNELVDSMSSLLELARYNSASYREWVDKDETDDEEATT
ncbi:PP_RS20740 family protein [Xanthomonas arboricola]|uniref:PP_RS20740 family protein n=1 Tax=Xanthomonas arboricola TaxID=56448 RepID=UPI00129078C7|nr:hypothetical protein [Xanthomonas arboricola]